MTETAGIVALYLPDKTLWLVIAGMAFVTFVPRIVPILLLSGRKMPDIVRRWLSLIAPAILSALLMPELLLNRSTTPATLALTLSNTYLLASVPAFLIAWKTKNLCLTVVVGLIAVALLRAFGF